MSFKEFMKRVLGIKRLSTVVNNNQQKDLSYYNLRDLQYARRMGQIEQIATDIATIKEKITGLDIKFDLRVPDKVLTESRFDEEISSSEDIYKELNAIKSYILELKRIVNNCQQLSTVINSNQQLSTLEKLEKSAENIESSFREKEILRHLKISKELSTEDIGKLTQISRSRANQILLEMERKGLVSRIKYGKKFLWIFREIQTR